MVNSLASEWQNGNFSCHPLTRQRTRQYPVRRSGPIMKTMLLLALLLPLPATAQITLLAHTAAGFSSGSGSSPVTTSAIDTTGASMIAICATGASSNTATPSDSASNTWLLANTQNEDGDLRVSLWYAIGPSTSATHTFTFNGQAPAGAVMAFSNVASGPDKQSQSMKGLGDATYVRLGNANKRG